MNERYEKLLKDLNEIVWNSAELKFAEFESAKAIEDVMRKEGFTVTSGLAGMETAFIARTGSGSPVIGILAEFDALSGLSQAAGVSTPCPREETNNGHGCGHSLLGTGSVGAALLIRDYLKESGKSGTVILAGCPAEEGGSGKAYMARAGVFDEMDVALTWHPAGGYAVMTGSMQANCQAYFRFKGISAHAAASPHLGRSALDAVELMNVGVNYMREHMESTDRIHYAVTDTGGISPNVVQSHAEVIYLIRSVDNDRVKRLYERVCKIAQGAALATETEVEIVFDKACSNILPNTVLEEALYETMLETSLPVFAKEELTLAEEMKPHIRPEDLMGEMSMQGRSEMEKKEIAKRLGEKTIADFVIEYKHSEECIAGSSDVGDCSHAIPTAQITGACFVPGTPLHSWLAVTQGVSPTALKAVYYVSDVLAGTAIKIINDPSIAVRANEEFDKRTDGKGYDCPIPADIAPNSTTQRMGKK